MIVLCEHPHAGCLAPLLSATWDVHSQRRVAHKAVQKGPKETARGVLDSTWRIVMENASPDGVLEMHAIVKGVVQGVGFRATARHLALKHQLVGTVRNLPTGEVEIYAIGNSEQLQLYLRELRSSGVGQIEAIDLGYSSAQREYRDFAITF